MLEEFCSSLKFLGLLYVIYYIFCPLLRILYNYLIAAKLFSGRKDLRKYGSWAIVTGATDGIGKAYAHELAKDGFNILLISRTESKLKDEANEIEKMYNVQTKICAVDFMKTTIYDEIKASISNLDVGVLVNNVGMSYAHPIYLHDQEIVSDEFMMGLINCNATSALMMIRLVMPGMIVRGNGGAIINISSYSGNYPIPFLSTYSATKAFVDFLSRGLHMEVTNRHNIEVQSVLPMFVATKMSRKRPSIFAPTPKAYVQSALSLIGIESRTWGCLSHAIQSFFGSLLPEFIHAWIIDSTMHKMMQAAAKKRLKSQ